MTKLTNDPVSSLDYIAVGETQKPKHILVLLHGSGTDHSDMGSLVEAFSKKIPADTLILIPNGPHLIIDLFPKDQAEAARLAQPDFDWAKARNWFGYISLEGVADEDKLDVVAKGMAPTAKMLNALIDVQMQKYNLEEKDLVIYGFSAGGVAALNTGLQRHEKPCAAVISHSGYFYGVENNVSKPKVLLVVGDQEVVESSPLLPLHELTKETLDMYGVSYKERVCKNLGHGFNEEAFDAVTGAIRTALGGPIDLSIEFEKAEEEPLPVRPKNTKRYKL